MTYTERLTPLEEAQRTLALSEAHEDGLDALERDVREFERAGVDRWAARDTFEKGQAA